MGTQQGPVRRCGWSFPGGSRVGAPRPKQPFEEAIPSQAPPRIPVVSLGKGPDAHCPADRVRGWTRGRLGRGCQDPQVSMGV